MGSCFWDWQTGQSGLQAGGVQGLPRCGKPSSLALLHVPYDSRAQVMERVTLHAGLAQPG